MPRSPRFQGIWSGRAAMSGVFHWFRLLAGGICLPLVFPYIVYKLYRLRWGSLKAGCLQDKVVLITGASSGLGEALAHKFFAAGCKVILASRRVAELERVKEDLLQSVQQPSVHHTPEVIQLDLADLSAIAEKAQQALRIHGRIDILVNSGGISYRGDACDTSIEVDVKLMMVNYFGHVALTKAILPSMMDMREGTIVAISSVQGKIGLPFRSAYAASKHATQAFFDSLLSEVAQYNIHVCVVSPGYIRTNLSMNALTGSGAVYGVMDETTATGMAPEDVADIVLEAVVNKRTDLVVASFVPRLVLLVRALLPWLYFAIMKGRAKRLRLQQRRVQ
ncbi:dehydrogenase/reductase SDR family protein 7-like isoform X3 [Haemaphysalis longicornis]